MSSITLHASPWSGSSSTKKRTPSMNRKKTCRNNTSYSDGDGEMQDTNIFDSSFISENFESAIEEQGNRNSRVNQLLNKITDAGLQALRYLTGLTHLDLTGMQRTDSGLWSVSLTELGVGAIATLKELRQLKLDGLPVSGRWLERLKGLTKLETLSLQGCTRIGDDAGAAIVAWPKLKAVDLKGTGMTGEALASIRQAKPGVRVFSGKWENPGTGRPVE